MWQNSTATRCIRYEESRNSYTRQGGGAYQFQGPSWTAMTGLRSAPQLSAPSLQDAAAYALWKYNLQHFGNGWLAWSTRFVCAPEISRTGY